MPSAQHPSASLLLQNTAPPPTSKPPAPRRRCPAASSSGGAAARSSASGISWLLPAAARLCEMEEGGSGPGDDPTTSDDHRELTAVLLLSTAGPAAAAASAASQQRGRRRALSTMHDILTFLRCCFLPGKALGPGGKQCCYFSCLAGGRGRAARAPEAAGGDAPGTGIIVRDLPRPAAALAAWIFASPHALMGFSPRRTTAITAAVSSVHQELQRARVARRERRAHLRRLGERHLTTSGTARTDTIKKACSAETRREATRNHPARVVR